jgi:5-methylcytosine-specific restriction endonuclease McrA
MSLAVDHYAYTRRERRRDAPWIRMFAVEAWVKQDHKCAYCRMPMARSETTGDHVESLSCGGATNRKNIKAACRDCNMTKGSMTKGAFLKAIKRPACGNIHVWMAWSRRRIWLRVERAQKHIYRVAA